MTAPTQHASIFGNPTLPVPDDSLAPPSGHFAEPWQVTTLALAAAMIREGRFTQSDWAEALGAAIRSANANGAPDTEASFFNAALTALETLTETTGIPASERAQRKTDWEAAYRRTPHGQPVEL